MGNAGVRGNHHVQRGGIADVKIRALSVFEGIVYHCWPTDTSDPCHPTLEVEAVLRDGDADAGPLLLSVADFVAMAGGREIAAPCLRTFAAEGRLVDHLGVSHISFPLRIPIDVSRPG
jgi:hypothetical protein